MCKSKTKSLALVFAAGLLLLSGCNKNGASEGNVAATENVSDGAVLISEEAATLKDETLQFLTTEHTSKEIEDRLLAVFEKLPAQDCTDIIDECLYGTYNAARQYELSDDETNKLCYIINSDGKFEYDKLEDETLKQKLSDLGEQHIVLRYVNGSMFYDVDYGYFQKTFGKYLNEDYDQMLRFYHEEKVNDYTDEGNTVLYTDIVEGRLDNLYEQKEKYKEKDTSYVFDEAYLFYKAVYLGAYADPYVWENEKIKDNVLNAYKNYIDVCKDPELRDFLRDIVDRLEAANGTRTVPIFEDIKNFCMFYETVEEQYEGAVK